MIFSKKYWLIWTWLLLALLLVGCGSATVTTGDPPTDTARPKPSSERPDPTQASATRAPTGGNQTPAVAGNNTAAGPSLTDQLGERTVVRSFQDAQGRAIKLIYGRGTGHNSDYGWAHIYGKHFKGIWYDGGTITTFQQAANATTPEAVVDLIGKSLQDKNPDDAGNGRRSYSYLVPGTNKDIFTVVGSDGTIITSYPVPHGSKDQDA